MGKGEKVNYLDIYRGIAIIAVLMIHTTSFSVAYLPKESFLYPVYFFMNSVSIFAVPAFLFLSSLVLVYNYADLAEQNWTRFYRKRLATITFPYLLWSLFYFLVVIDVEGSSFLTQWPNFFRDLLTGGNYTHLYFLVVIFQFYLLFPLFLMLIRVRLVRSNLIIAGIVAQAVFYLLNYYFFHMEKVGTFVGSYFLYFFLGAYAGLKMKDNKDWLNKVRGSFHIWLLLLGAGYILQLWMQRFSPHWIPQPWLSWTHFLFIYAYAGTCCVALIYFSRRLDRFRLSWVSNTLHSLGRASFGIYLAHPFFLLVWRLKVMTNEPLLYHLLVWLGGGLALALSWAITMWLEKTSLGVAVVGRKRVNQKGKREG